MRSRLLLVTLVLVAAACSAPVPTSPVPHRALQDEATPPDTTERGGPGGSGVGT